MSIEEEEKPVCERERVSVCVCVCVKVYQVSYTVEPPNNGHIGDEYFVHCLEVVPSSEVEMYVGKGRTVCPL